MKMKLRMDLSCQISLPISLTISSSDHHLLLSNQQTHIKPIKQTETWHEIELKIKSQLNWLMKIKSDQIINHHPSSQNYIIKLEIWNQKSNERNFDPTNHHKIPKHDKWDGNEEILSSNSSQTFQSFKISLIFPNNLSRS